MRIYSVALYMSKLDDTCTEQRLMLVGVYCQWQRVKLEIDNQKFYSTHKKDASLAIANEAYLVFLLFKTASGMGTQTVLFRELGLVIFITYFIL